MTSETDLIKKLFAMELNRCCEERYQIFPSNEKLSRDLYFSSKYKLKVNRETIRKWLRGETFPDLDCLLHLIEWLELNMSNVFLTNKNESDGCVYNPQIRHLSDRSNGDVTSEQIDLVVSFLHRIKKCQLYKKGCIKATSMNNRIAWDVMSLLCPVIAAANSDEVTSAAADFRTLALSVHNPAERLAAATQLFRAHGET